MKSAAAVTLEGRLEKITYRHPDSHYTIARFNPGRGSRPVTVVGYLPGIQPGESLKVSGRWETHLRYGPQFKLVSFEVTLPATVEGVEAYLMSGTVAGIGPAMARRLVDHFGADTLEVIENTPQRLKEVRGIGRAKSEAICSAWTQQHAIRSLMGFLQQAGVAPAHGIRLLRLYGTDALETLRKDPYRVIEDLPRIGFAIGDAVARDLGLPAHAAERLQAGFIHLLDRSVSDGHVFVDQDKLIAQCANLTGVGAETVAQALADFAASGKIVIARTPEPSQTPAVYPKSLYAAETGVAERLRARLTLPVISTPMAPAALIERVHRRLAVAPTPEQIAALEAALIRPVLIITGGPGTGKTTLIRAMTAVFDDLGKRVLLAAPTGRAARRISEVTAKKATTIHRLLGYQAAEGTFDRDQDDPLRAEVLIVDEASMIDLALMFDLLKAVSLTTTLVLVGDRNQLPPVGPGNVLADMIRSGKFPTVELTRVFRQAEESLIIRNAHRALRGEFPAFDPPDPPDGLSEFYFFQQPDPKLAAAAIVDMCQKDLPHQFGLDPVKDIQVLTPMHKGDVGVLHLNQLLQNALNPRIPSHTSGQPGRFRVGDKVMQLKNNYPKEVFNGDIGVIDTLGPENDRVTVCYQGRHVGYKEDELDELTLAYAISVHKSQGSEYPAVILPIMTQHYPLLYRNLLYTGMTRGRQLVIIIGTSKALEIALKNDTPQKRLSRLAERLAGEEDVEQ